MNDVSFIVMVSKQTDFWHSKITYCKAFDEQSISQTISMLKGTDKLEPVAIRIFPISSKQVGITDSLDFMWQEGLSQEELVEYLYD